MEVIAIDFEDDEGIYLENLVQWLEHKMADPECHEDKRYLWGWLRRTKKELEEWRKENEQSNSNH